jgi:hypothetical protein
MPRGCDNNASSDFRICMLEALLADAGLWLQRL